MKILVIRFSPVASIVMASPLLRCLKQQLPEAEIHFLTREEHRQAVEFNPHISRLHLLAHSRELMLEELVPEAYDLIIDLENDSTTHHISHFLGVKTLKAPSLAGKMNIFRMTGLNLLPKKNYADIFLSLVAELGVRPDRSWLEYFITSAEETRKEDIPASHYAGFIACVIADEGERQWPHASWVAFCKEMEHPVILLGEKKDAARGEEIAASDPVKIYNACGKFSYNECADLVSKARLVIAPTTGLMYIAAAYKRPLLWLDDKREPAILRSPYYSEDPAGTTAKPFFVRCSLKENNASVLKKAKNFLW